MTQGTAPALRISNRLRREIVEGTLLKLVMLGGLMLLILIVAAASRLMPHGTAAEATMLHFHLQNDDDLIAKP